LDAADKLDKSAMPTDTVYTAGAQTLADKTLSSNTIASALNDATRRLLDLSGSGGTGTTCDRVQVTTQAAGSNAIVGVASSNLNASLELRGKGSGTVVLTGSGDVVGTTGAQILSNKTLTTPAIADFTSATHTHQNTAGGGTLNTSAIATGTMSQDRLADTANRSGSYTGALTTRILRSDSTAAGSNGIAQWTQRERVAQTKTQIAQYTSTAANSPNYPSLSQFGIAASESGWNTLPDCNKETGATAPFTVSGTPLTGKILQMTAYGIATTVGASRGINFRIRHSGADLFATGYAFSGSVTGTSIWTLQVNMVYTGSSGSGAAVHSFATCAMIRDLTPATAITTLMNAIGASGVAPVFTFTDGGSFLFELQSQLTGTSNVGDILECRSCIWEVLN
jgi:hypothetical protein